MDWYHRHPSQPSRLEVPTERSANADKIHTGQSVGQLYGHGDFNAYSPFDADWVETHAQLIKNKQKWDAEQETYRNMRDGRLDYSVLSQFLSIGLTDICRLYVPADKRTTFPTAFLYRWQHGDTRLHGISERLDYILVSPSLVSRCVDAHIHNGIETEGISDHYPVSVDLIIHL